MTSLLQAYSQDDFLEMIYRKICNIGYVEKAIKFKGEEVIHHKIAIGCTDFLLSDRKELIRRWIGTESLQITENLDLFEHTLDEMKDLGYHWDKSRLHLGKELHGNIWKPEIYVYHSHPDHPNAFGMSFDLGNHTYSQYEVFHASWLEALISLRTFLSNVEYNHLTYVLGHCSDMTHKHIRKIDKRYLYNIYFSLFLPYEEIKQDLYALVIAFTGKHFQEYAADFVAFPILAMIHVSQEVDGPRQFSLYFRPKDT